MGTNAALQLWNLDDATLVRNFIGHEGDIICLNDLGTDDRFVSGSMDRTLRLWDLRSMTCLHVLTNHTQWVGSVDFSPDGRLLVSAGCDEILWLWDVQSATYLQSIAPERLYKRLYMGMNITNAIGLTDAQKLTLRELGAIDR